MTQERILLTHGTGGESTRELIQKHLLPVIGNPILNALADAAVLPAMQGRPVFTTDAFVVAPAFFPGGDIGMLSVIGTCNDLAMMGAVPRWLSLAFILEESLPLERFDTLLASIAKTAREAGVEIVAGDTKVVERGKADQVFITTAGLGELHLSAPLQPSRIRPGDTIIVSNEIGRHGMAVLARREGIQLDVDIQTDAALLSPLIQALLQENIELHCARDATRGGLGGALLELAGQSGLGFAVDEANIPVTPSVAAACEWLGYDPLFVANEGCCVMFVPRDQSFAAVEILQTFSAGRWAAAIGTVADSFRDVRLRNAFGMERPLSWHTVDQLPRIC